MDHGMNIAFFGSSLVSAYWNGAATYYRGIIRALAERGHHITFYEPDAFERQAHRDMEDPEWARVVVYQPTEAAARRCLEEARDADLIVKASGVGVLDEFLEEAVLELKTSRNLVAFWDVDAPATLERTHNNPADPFRPLIPQYDLILTYGGGPRVIARYSDLDAKQCVPIYNALDDTTHHPVAPDPRFEADLNFLGNRMPDREQRVKDFFFDAARRLPERKFLLGGSGWEQGADLPANVHHVGHVYTRDHNAFNCTPLAVLNISRDSMASYGYSPATRVFEAAGAGACLITDAWWGIDHFLEPGDEVLVAENGAEVAEHLKSLTPQRAREIGLAARSHILAHHTYAHRARELESLLHSTRTPSRRPAAAATAASASDSAPRGTR